MNTSIRSVYLVTETIKDALLSDSNINTVTYGDITDIDLSKQTIFPLAHIMINSVTNRENVLNYNLSVFVMDVVDMSKDETTDIFRGNDNEQDVLNTQLAVINKVVTKLRGGDLYRDKYQLDADVTFEPFVERFENNLAGFVGTMDIVIPNDIDICA